MLSPRKAANHHTKGAREGRGAHWDHISPLENLPYCGPLSFCWAKAAFVSKPPKENALALHTLPFKEHWFWVLSIKPPLQKTASPFWVPGCTRRLISRWHFSLEAQASHKHAAQEGFAVIGVKGLRRRYLGFGGLIVGLRC